MLSFVLGDFWQFEFETLGYTGTLERDSHPGQNLPKVGSLDQPWPLLSANAFDEGEWKARSGC